MTYISCSSNFAFFFLNFHGPVILPYIFKSINILPFTSQCDLKFDLKTKVTVAYVQRSPYFNSYLLKISNAWSALSENNSFKMMYWFIIVTPYLTGLGGSVGCSV